MTEFECKAPDGTLIQIPKYTLEFLKEYHKAVASANQSELELSLSNYLIDEPKNTISITEHSDWSFAHRLDPSRTIKKSIDAAKLNAGSASQAGSPSERSILVVYVETNDSIISVSEQEVKNAVFGDCDSVTTTLRCQFAQCSLGKILFSPASADIKDGFGNPISGGLAKVKVSLNAYGDGLSPSEIRNNALDVLERANNAASLKQLADHVIVVVPPGDYNNAANASGDWLTTFNDAWITDAVALMHELGHNLGFDHSLAAYHFEEGRFVVDAWDMHGYMATTQFTPRTKLDKCFNVAWVSSLNGKDYLGWYDERVIHELTNPITEEIIGIVDYVPNSQHNVSIAVVGESKRIHIGYNKATGFNRETEGSRDKIVIIQEEPSILKTLLLASLKENEEYVINDFWGAGKTLRIRAEEVPVGIPDTLQFAKVRLESGIPGDLDGDYIPDVWELAYFTSISSADGSADSDNDGVVDFFEYLYGSDPTLASQSGFRIVLSHHAPELIFSWEVANDITFGENYNAEISFDLNLWNPLPHEYYPENMQGGTTEVKLNATNDSESKVFFRLVKPNLYESSQ